MIKKILWFALILIVLLSLIIALAPARAIFPFIADKVPGLMLSQASGSIWSSQIKTAKYRNVTLNQIDLEMDALPLLAGDLEGKLKVDDPNLELNAALKFNKEVIGLNNVNYKIDASWLHKVAQMPLERLTGAISGKVKIAEYNNKTNSILSLQGEGLWSGAGLSWPNFQFDLGDIRYELSKLDDKRIEVQILENNGPFDLKGSISLSTSKQYQIDINLTEELPASIANSIKLIGKVSNGRVYIKWRGRLR